MVIGVVSDKGGVGKSTLAYELAAALGAVLIDLDWSGGGVSASWGFDHRRRTRRPLLDSLASGRPPHYLRHRFRPALVPSHPDLVDIEPSAALAQGLVARRLQLWSEAWGLPVVVDTHPGFNGLTTAAIAAADLLVVPLLLREKELNALDQMLQEGLTENRVLLVPNMVPAVTPRAQLKRLKALLRPFEGLPVAPPVSFHPWWTRRQLRSALVLAPNPGRRVARAAEELRAVAEAVRQHAL
ncbi:MAG TPA: ParA family protein [Candidatus Dormibacteraeota bacterium]|jgi:chromosome partitioning protein